MWGGPPPPYGAPPYMQPAGPMFGFEPFHGGGLPFHNGLSELELDSHRLNDSARLESHF